MKKFFTITLLTLAMMFFVACGGGSSKGGNSTEPTDEPTTPTDEPTNPTDEPTNPTDEPTNPDEPTEPTTPSNCTGLSVDWSTLAQYQYSNQFLVTNEDQDPVVLMAFFQDMETGAITAGTYNLAAGDNANYKTCTECVLVYADYVEEEGYAKTYYQQSGTLKVDAVDDSNNIKGSINAVLVQVTIDENDYTSTPVEGGSCLEIETANFDSGWEEPCVPQCDGKQCGSDGCGGTCGTCEGQACSEDFQCVPFECENLEFGEDSVELVKQPGYFGTSYYYEANTLTAGDATLKDFLRLHFYNEGITAGTIDLGTGNNANYKDCTECFLFYEDVEEEEGSYAKMYFQESGELVFDEVKEGTYESKGHASFRLIEVTIDSDTYESIPTAGGKCYNVSNLTWDTICIPQCDGKQCGDDGCGGTCGTCEDQACSADYQCVPFDCTEITLDTEAGTVDSYGGYETSYTPFTGDEEIEDIFGIELYAEDFDGTHDLANTNYKDCDICLLVREDDYAKNYFQNKGTVTFTTQESAAGTKVTAQISGLRLEEVSISSEDFSSIPVAGGACLDVTNTTVTYTIPAEEED